MQLSQFVNHAFIGLRTKLSSTQSCYHYNYRNLKKMGGNDFENECSISVIIIVQGDYGKI